MSTFLHECESVARSVFGFSGLRAHQKQVLQALETENNVLATMSTGAGKTLLYSVPPLVWKNGLVVVICPLIALMRDQVRRLQSTQLTCAMLTSEQLEAERRTTWTLLREGRVQILFVSPERFLLPRFLNFLSKQKISLAVVDEAHCIVSWGFDFRPEYFELKEALEKIRPHKTLVVTATASSFSRDLICETVFPSNNKVTKIVFPPLGEHIFVESLRVYSEDEKWMTLIDVLKQAKSLKSLVYFSRRDACEQAALKLQKMGFRSLVYHAGMQKSDKVGVENFLQQSNHPTVVCATLAFGMGIDLAGVGLVVAFGFPSNIEEYFQMIGRAGRGGETSRTLLLWSGSDPIKREYQLKQTFLKVSELNLYLASLIGFFPTEMSQRFVTGAEIQRTLKLSPSEFDKKFGLLASALRVLGASTRCRKNQGELLYIEWKKGTNLTTVLENLPNEPTKRQIVLSSLSRLSDAGWSKQNGATGVFYTSDVILETALSLPVILQVLQFYANEGVLGYTQLETQESLQGIILTTTYKKAVASVSRYANIKSQGVESLDQLQALATAKTCRLEKAHVFFGGKENSNLRQKVQKCMQCDLCFQTQFHQKSTIPFAGFQTSRNLETAVQL